MTTEQQVIEQLSQYRQKKARIQALSTYSVGAGITVSRLNEDDQLQELHRRLRGLPSYMYLSAREQKLESIAHAYLGGKYPSGIKMQKRAVSVDVMDDEDQKLLREVRGKIQKVIEARGYDIREGLDEIIERLTKLQDLQAEVERIEVVLDTLEQYKPDYANLLRLVFSEELKTAEVCDKLKISKTTFYDQKKKALAEYVYLAR
ncbi:DUF1492 domain-containing protein [Paenibacillus glucanolyticus]|uniref:DUF1492 domain-containing protein n=1 Tax=Paenibacillus glucanolyticus TaxID=59843 RepID=UPI0035DAE671